MLIGSLTERDGVFFDREVRRLVEVSVLPSIPALGDPLARCGAGFFAESFGEMADGLVADVECGFRDIRFSAKELLTSMLNAQAAEVTLEGEAGFGASLPGKVMWSNADVFRECGKIERLVELYGEAGEGALNRVSLAHTCAESGWLSCG